MHLFRIWPYGDPSLERYTCYHDEQTRNTVYNERRQYQYRRGSRSRAGLVHCLLQPTADLYSLLINAPARGTCSHAIQTSSPRSAAGVR